MLQLVDAAKSLDNVKRYCELYYCSESLEELRFRWYAFSVVCAFVVNYWFRFALS